ARHGGRRRGRAPCHHECGRWLRRDGSHVGDVQAAARDTRTATARGPCAGTEGAPRMTNLTQAAYLLTAILFILGIMRLRSPATARSGNALAAAGMVLALAMTLISQNRLNGGVLGGGMAVGTVLGVVAARKVRMTAMPQMVALFNGMGAGAAALVAAGEIIRQLPTSTVLSVGATAVALFTVLIGCVSFAGSLLAFAKLQEVMTG